MLGFEYGRSGVTKRSGVPAAQNAKFGRTTARQSAPAPRRHARAMVCRKSWPPQCAVDQRRQRRVPVEHAETNAADSHEKATFDWLQVGDQRQKFSPTRWSYVLVWPYGHMAAIRTRLGLTGWLAGCPVEIGGRGERATRRADLLNGM